MGDEYHSMGGGMVIQVGGRSNAALRPLRDKSLAPLDLQPTVYYNFCPSSVYSTDYKVNSRLVSLPVRIHIYRTSS
jgi:hypothetical protein